MDQMNNNDNARTPARGPGVPSMGYRRKKDTGIWHSHPHCSNWPTRDYFTSDRKPDPLHGNLCKECEDHHK